ncbi:hypothetical protein [Embleya sp. NBC_00896]|uniref:hypothetical protein n=1 Tax=Embleya sp. NBC_00896 TaxID=2975961 RepID=UPI0038701EAE|nr:hypothetical protein OG928_24985 [Embleya sp. NBC_00896]
MVITFSAWRDSTYDGYIGLAEILGHLGTHGVDLEWSCEIDELAPEPHDPALESLTHRDRISTTELLRLVTPNKQIIDGRFDGMPPETRDPTVSILAIDSSEWEIESADPDLVHRLLSAYPDGKIASS